MMFYNGFNLLIDIILCSIVGVAAIRHGWLSGYSSGWVDGAKDMKKELTKISR